MEKIGLIAGNRKFPLLFAECAKKKGCSIVAVAIKGETSAQLRHLADKIYWLDLKDFNRLFDIFKFEGVTKVVMAGQISPRRLFSRIMTVSPVLRELLDSLKDKRANTIFTAIADKLNEAELEVLDSTTYLEDFIPVKGVLTSKKPTTEEWEDIQFGMDLAKKVAELDIGQTVAVKNKAIIGVEAFEGTDNLIRRAGRLARGGITVAKVSRPQQDMRFDIPVIGLNTVKNLCRVKARCLAIEAGKTLFLDRPASIALADSKGISIVAV